MLNLKKYKINDESFEDDEDNNLKDYQQAEREKPSFTNKLESEFGYPKKSAFVIEDSESAINLQNQSEFSNINPTETEHIKEKEHIFEEQVRVEEPKTNYHHVQIVDEDVEHFKRRLDISIKNFRTDTLKDFMGIKRHLLTEQKSIIESEKQKCDAMVSSKIDQIEHLKETLANTKIELFKTSEQKENLGLFIFRFKEKERLDNLRIKAFGKLKKHYDYKHKCKHVYDKIRGKLIARLKAKGFGSLNKNHSNTKLLNMLEAKDKECQNKLNEMAQYYGKEITDLRNKLNEANHTLESFKESKSQIQDNLKKALMRGVVAMNLEAMNILEPESLNAMNNLLSSDITPIEHKISNTGYKSYNDDTKVNLFASTETPGHKSTDINSHNYEQSGFNYIPERLEKKVTIKDSAWVNACAVPGKMKSDLIMKNEFEEESFENEAEKGYTIAPVPLRNNINSNNYYEELTKNLSNIKSDFNNIVSRSSQSQDFESSFGGPQQNDHSFVKNSVNVNVNQHMVRADDNIFNNNYISAHNPISKKNFNNISANISEKPKVVTKEAKVKVINETKERDLGKTKRPVIKKNSTK